MTITKQEMTFEECTFYDILCPDCYTECFVFVNETKTPTFCPLCGLKLETQDGDAI